MQKSFTMQMKKCAVSAVVGMAVTAVLLIIVAAMMYYEVLSCENLAVIAFLTLFAGCICAGKMCCAKVREGKWRYATACSAIIYIVVICLTLAVSFEELFSVNSLINALTVLSGTFLGAVFCVKSTKKKRRNRTKLNR